jgi:hypothetical protein
MKARIAPQEGLHRVARFQCQKLARAEAAGVFLDHDLDKAIPAAGSERIEARHGRPFGQDAKKIARLKPCKSPARQPRPQGRLGQGKAQVT